MDMIRLQSQMSQNSLTTSIVSSIIKDLAETLKIVAPKSVGNRRHRNARGDQHSQRPPLPIVRRRAATRRAGTSAARRLSRSPRTSSGSTSPLRPGRPLHEIPRCQWTPVLDRAQDAMYMGGRHRVWGRLPRTRSTRAAARDRSSCHSCIPEQRQATRGTAPIHRQGSGRIDACRRLESSNTGTSLPPVGAGAFRGMKLLREGSVWC